MTNSSSSTEPLPSVSMPIQFAVLASSSKDSGSLRIADHICRSNETHSSCETVPSRCQSQKANNSLKRPMSSTRNFCWRSCTTMQCSMFLRRSCAILMYSRGCVCDSCTCTYTSKLISPVSLPPLCLNFFAQTAALNGLPAERASLRSISTHSSRVTLPSASASHSFHARAHSSSSSAFARICCALMSSMTANARRSSSLAVSYSCARSLHHSFRALISSSFA